MAILGGFWRVDNINNENRYICKQFLSSKMWKRSHQWKLKQKDEVHIKGNFNNERKLDK